MGSLVQLRHALHAEPRARTIPLQATRLELKWSGQLKASRMVQISHASPQEFPFGYGFQPSLEGISTSGLSLQDQTSNSFTGGMFLKIGRLRPHDEFTIMAQRPQSISLSILDFGHSGIDPLQTRQERAGVVLKLGEVC
jgi:hypothetical protein